MKYYKTDLGNQHFANFLLLLKQKGVNKVIL